MTPNDLQQSDSCVWLWRAVASEAAGAVAAGAVAAGGGDGGGRRVKTARGAPCSAHRKARLYTVRAWEKAASSFANFETFRIWLRASIEKKFGYCSFSKSLRNWHLASC